MTTDNAPSLKMAQAMWKSGIAQDRNNPHAHKEFTQNAITVLNRRYVIKDETGKPVEHPNQVFRRVAHNLAQADRDYPPAFNVADIHTLSTEEQVKQTEEAFFNVMDQLLCLPNSPTLMNAGAKLQQLSACFVLPVDDSLDAIFEGVKRTALIHKSGGGTGFDFSRLRPKNDTVGSTGGVASGPVGFIRAFDTATDVVKQGGTRRGANMAVLRVDHPDIMEFIHCKDSGDALENFNISVGITDVFMQALRTDSDYDLINPRNAQVTQRMRARTIWDHIIQSAHLTGDPGLIFLDTINANNPNPHLGPIEAVNPCVTGDTIVYTSQGLKPISEMLEESQFHSIATDRRFQKGQLNLTTAVMPSGIKPVYQLRTHEGYDLRLTADHRVMTQRGWVAASQLTHGDLIHISNSSPGYGHKGDHHTGTILGSLAAYATLNDPSRSNANPHPHGAQTTAPQALPTITQEAPVTRNTSAVAEKEPETLPQTPNTWGTEPYDNHRVTKMVFQGTQTMQLGFLQGLFSANGQIFQLPDKGPAIRITPNNDNHEYILKVVQKVLLNLGIVSTVQHSPADTSTPHDRKDTRKPDASPQIALTISGQSVPAFRDKVGFVTETKQRQLDAVIESQPPPPHEEQFVARFKSLDYEGLEEVYDLTEPNSHSFIANGIVVSNCGEQPLLANESCNLASINLARMVSYPPDQGPAFINWDLLHNTCYTTVHMLDNVIDMNRYPYEDISRVTKATRRIGIGVMGLADMLVQLGIPYDSQEARELAGKVMDAINKMAHTASKELAQSRGPYPEMPHIAITENNTPKPIRNTAPTTIAPTGTISIIAGASSGIEPLFALAYTRNVMDQTKLEEVNPYLLEAAKAHGFYSEELMQHVAQTGTVQNTDVPQWVKDVFKTSQDISPKDHVLMQAAFQQHVANGVSKTINFPSSATTGDIEEAYLLAHENGCKGITVYRDGSKAGQVLSTGQTSHSQNGQQLPAVNGRTQARPRPRVMTGRTERIRTGHGNMYMTINFDENEEPFECFSQVGRAGGCDSAQLEAISRLISLALRANIDPDEVITNLNGITCCPIWDDGTRVNSIPDALAQGLSKSINPNNHQQPVALTIPMDINVQTFLGPQVLCPDCYSPVIFKEGCEACTSPSCGWNKCE